MTYSKDFPYLEILKQIATEGFDILPEGMTGLDFPASHRRKIRTVNGLERVNEEVNRRTRVADIFLNEAACLCLVSAILMELDEDWQTGRACLNFEPEESSYPS